MKGVYTRMYVMDNPFTGSHIRLLIYGGLPIVLHTTDYACVLFSRKQAADFLRVFRHVSTIKRINGVR